jgi:AAA domain
MDSHELVEVGERPRFKAFRELGELSAEPEWLWRGFLSPGSLTLLAGHPFKGKSMLVGGLLRALAKGEPFLGRETSNATALLVTEEDDSVLRQRAELLGLLDLEGAYISRSSGVTRYPWPELVAAAADRAVLDGHSLLVFDTFPGLAQLGDEQENDAGAISERLRPLLNAASLGLAVLFPAPHERLRTAAGLEGVPRDRRHHDLYASRGGHPLLAGDGEPVSDGDASAPGRHAGPGQTAVVLRDGRRERTRGVAAPG